MRLQLDLRDAFAIPKIDKNDAALIADRVHPTEQGNSFAEIGFGELGAVMSPVHAGKTKVFEQANAPAPEQAQPLSPKKPRCAAVVF
jgi:hypothetical protein